jgi:hypothetical protein
MQPFSTPARAHPDTVTSFCVRGKAACRAGDGRDS